MNRLTSLGAVAVLTLLSACADESLPVAPSIGYGDASGRGGRPIQFIDGTVGLAWDARPAAVDAPPPPDAPTRRDVAAGADTMPSDVRADPRECSLLTQVCPRLADACYPAGHNGTECLLAGNGPSGAQCAHHEECSSHFICLSDQSLCVQLCEPDSPCVNKARCLPLPGYNNLGYCPP